MNKENISVVLLFVGCIILMGFYINFQVEGIKKVGGCYDWDSCWCALDCSSFAYDKYYENTIFYLYDGCLCMPSGKIEISPSIGNINDYKKFIGEEK